VTYLNNILANIELDETEKKTCRGKIYELYSLLLSLDTDFLSLDPFEKNKNLGNLSAIIEESTQIDNYKIIMDKKNYEKLLQHTDINIEFEN